MFLMNSLNANLRANRVILDSIEISVSPDGELVGLDNFLHQAQARADLLAQFGGLGENV